MSEEFDSSTCRVDPEVDLVETALPPTAADIDEEQTEDEALAGLPDAERELIDETLAELRPELEAIPTEEVQTYRRGAAAALRNSRLIAKNLKPHLEKLRKEMPFLNHERIARIELVAIALVFVTASAAREARVGSSRRKQRSNAYRVRRLLLQSLTAAATKGLIPQEDVDQIAAGQGFADVLDDIAAMVRYFEKHWSLLENNSPVDRLDLAEARELVSELVPRVTPEGRLMEPERGPSELVDLRNRLWTLLVGDHEEAVVAGTYLYRQKVARKIPPLLAGSSRAPSKVAPTAQEEAEMVKPEEESEEQTG